MKKFILFLGLLVSAFFTLVIESAFASQNAELTEQSSKLALINAQMEPGNSLYTINYELNSGRWNSVDKEDLKIDFLTDFYYYINPSENLTTFMHGVGKTTGYDGTWHSAHIDMLYKANDKTENPETPFFINQPYYNGKWVPFFDLLEVLVKETNATQSFWGSPYVGKIRIKEYFTGTRYGDDNRLPDNLPLLMDYQKYYNAGTLPLILPVPTKDNYVFVGWFDNPDFTGDPVTQLLVGNGDKFFYAKWEGVSYSISYQLNGGNLAFSSRNALKDAFLLDFYNYIAPVEDLNTFKHGVGKTSGYDGTWHSVYQNRLYDINRKEIEVGATLFINRPEYNYRWLPFYNLLDQFIKEINPDQSLWTSTYVGYIRFRQYFINDALFASKTTLPNCEGPAKYLYDSNKVSLPTPSKSGSTFLGWYDNASFSGTRVYEVSPYTIGNKTFYAKWSVTDVGDGYIDLTYSGNQVLTIGATTKVTATWKKITLTDTFNWTSSNAAVATVDASGNVKGVTAGTAVIRATSSNTGVFVEIGFTVYGSEISDPLLKYLITQNSGKLFTQNIYYIGYNGSYWNRNYGTVNRYLAAAHDTVDTSMWLQGGIKGSGNYMNPLYITIHDTGSATSSSTARANGGWCVNPSNTGSSWHYTVGNDGVFQHISRYRQAWHAGDGSGPGNTQSIGIETTVNNGSDIWLTWQKTAKLVGRIMVEEGLTMTALKYHRDWSGKICPGTMINAGLTTQFKQLVEAEYNIQKNYSGYTITFQSHSSLINSQGRVVSRPAANTNISYTITVKKGTTTQSVTLFGMIPGTNTF